MGTIKKIWITPYTLTQKVSRQKHEGLLLKVLFAPDKVGYGSLQPWSQFHEGVLSDYIPLLKEGFSKNSVTEIPLSFRQRQKIGVQTILKDIQMDAEARARNQSLISGHPPIQNHYLISDIHSITSLDSFPFLVFKIKMGKNVNKNTHQLRQVLKKTTASILLRLDFNNGFSRKEWEIWERENKDLSQVVDFIEDPFLNFYPIPSFFSLAQDWSSIHYCPIRVIKGSRFSMEYLHSQVARSTSARFIFTHSLSHPLEARLSWVKASQFYKIHPQKREICGLDYNTHFYDKNDFSVFHSSFYSPLGTGLGFDELLEKQNWKLL